MNSVATPPTGAPATQRRSGGGFSFLDANRALAQFTGGPDLPFLFGMSGTAEPLGMYLDAAGATRGRRSRTHFLPFGTLGQFLASGERSAEAEVFLLFPWDFAHETDWRSGVPRERVDLAGVIARAEAVARSLVSHTGARLLYVPAPTPPVVGYPDGDDALRRQLTTIAVTLGARLVPADAFSLAKYFSSGCPVAAGWLGRVADMAVASLLAPPGGGCKVLVTDLDETVWSGVIAEAGPEGIAYGPDGEGFRHFVYQTLVARLRREGVLLAAVSRNDRVVVDAPLASGRMPLTADDFVAVCASYDAKSAQVRGLATALNVGLDAMVFVDDNPVECEEVRTALPQVTVIEFPERDDGLPALLEALSSAFGQRTLTEEDRDRTALYRRRLDTTAPAAAGGADLTHFLSGLAMRLVIHDRSYGDHTRAVQLINKTNQFNANGHRWSESEVAAALSRGGRLFTGTLSDRAGSHGEIIACLVAAGGTIDALVMSCRVFQRRVEDAFLAALVLNGVHPTAIRFAETERNEPFRRFVADPAFKRESDTLITFNPAQWALAHRSALELVDVSWS